MRRRLVMAYQLYLAAINGRVDEVRRLLDQGVPPDEYRGGVSAAPAAAGGACTDALYWGAPVPHWRAGRVDGADAGSRPRPHGHCAVAAGPRRQHPACR